MSHDWAPVVRSLPAPVKELSPIPVPPQVVVMPADPAPRPKRWTFIPLRDQNNLIVEVVATPEY